MSDKEEAEGADIWDKALAVAVMPPAALLGAIAFRKFRGQRSARAVQRDLDKARPGSARHKALEREYGAGHTSNKIGGIGGAAVSGGVLYANRKRRKK